MPLTFRTLGRSNQAVVATAADLAQVTELADALWVATAVPSDTLRFDPVFLGFVDADGDGRLRSDEVRAAIRWTLATLRNPAALRPGNATLALADVATDGDGATVLTAARGILEQSGSPARKELALDEIRKVRIAEEAKGLSAAGKVLPAAAGDDAALAAFLGHVVAVTGGEPHPAGGAAVSAAALQAFLDAGAAALAWHDAPTANPAIRPIPDADAAADAHVAVEKKLEQYFLLCDAVHLDPGLAARAWIDATQTDLLDPVAAAGLLEKAPLARPRADGVLEIGPGLNPAWRARIEAWVSSSVRGHGLDPARVDRALVGAVAAKVAPLLAWRAAKPAGTALDGGADALRAHVGDGMLATRTRELLTASEAAAKAFAGLRLVEKLALYQAWLLPLANVMVAIPDLFDPTVKGWFERGKLVIDGREFDLAIKVNDVARAERFAAMSPLFTMFVKVGATGNALSEELMVPVTAGEREHLVDGMWGVFHDVDGTERHAQIRKMIANPISIREAILAPIRTIGETIQGALDKAAASQQSAMSASVSTAATSAADKTANAASNAVAAGTPAAPAPAPAPADPAAAPPPAAPAPAPSPLGNLPVLLAGAGIALGAIGAFVTEALTMLFSATAQVSAQVGALAASSGAGEGVAAAVTAASFPFSLALVVIGALGVPFLIYATPVAIATWFRLRRRDLATLLEGSGWAVNTRLYLDDRLAVQLTTRPTAKR